MRFTVLLIALFVFTCCNGQGVFKKLPKPNTETLSKAKSVSAQATISAWRLTGPIAGFMYPQNQVVTGIGYGYQRLRWIDSAGKWYTNYSISGVVYAGGNVTPSLSPNNIISIGVSVGFLNQLLNVGPCYNFANGSNKGSVGVVFNFSMPLNN